LAKIGLVVLPELGDALPSGLDVTYKDSYLWRLRQAVGSDLVLMPGAMVAVQREDQRVLLIRRSDERTWCLPGGAAEPGGSFARTAIDELREETGIEVSERDLTPFGCLSEAEAHTIRYPNGDVTHCFALLFLARAWRGDAVPDGEESTEVGFFELEVPPEPLHPPTGYALDLLGAYLDAGSFQVR
jgi:8-oxo-dGTP pyrophosphatase MutT (NUDIX family)